MSGRFPNFFVVGAPKAGTSSLYYYLAQHPQIYMSPIKEPTFFAKADLLSGRRRERTLQQIEEERPALQAYLRGPMEERKWLLVLDPEDYLELFRNVRDEIAVGEASVGYFWLPSAAGAIRNAIPEARLIFVLRDPAEMVFSQYLAGMAVLSHRPFRPWFRDALDSPEARLRWMEAPQYATQLARFFSLFPRDQASIHLYEDYRADAPAMLRDLFQFLQVDPSFTVDFSQRYNEPRVPRHRWLHAVRRMLPRGLPLTNWLPGPIRRAWRKRYYQSRQELRMDPADRQMVIDHYRDEIVRTGEMIGRDLSAWLK